MVSGALIARAELDALLVGFLLGEDKVCLGRLGLPFSAIRFISLSLSPFPLLTESKQDLQIKLMPETQLISTICVGRVSGEG